MIKFLICISICINTPLIFAAHIPSEEESSFNEITLRYLKKSDELRYIGEIKLRNSFDDQHEYHLKYGANYRLFTHLKLGLHLQHQKGVRHDDNWVVVPSPGSGWEWNEEDNDIETLIIPELILRAMIVGRLRGELRLQYENNFNNDHQTAKIRPGLTYFWFLDGEIFMNLYVMHEKYRPLNFGNKSDYQSWSYVGFLHHLTENHKWGINYSTGEWLWTDSKDFIENNPTETYEVKDKASIIGLNYTFTH